MCEHRGLVTYGKSAACALSQLYCPLHSGNAGASAPLVTPGLQPLGEHWGWLALGNARASAFLCSLWLPLFWKGLGLCPFGNDGAFDPF